MSEIFDTLGRWLASGERVAIATVISVDGSAPRDVGAKMLIAQSGRIAGSVSGGCVESNVAEEAQSVLASGRPTIARYGINRNMMWDVGLSCGGAIDVFIERADPHAQVPVELAGVEPFAACTVVRGADRVGAKLVVRADGTSLGSTGDDALDRRIAQAAVGAIERGQPQSLRVDAHEIFADVFVPQPRLVIVGAVHTALALSAAASAAGFAVTIIDPRPQLNARERFPHASELRVGWPEDELPKLRIDESTYVAVLTHDEKFDDPTLAHVLRTRAKYVGAIGSKKTQALRRRRLLDAGFSERDVDRVHAPIGLDIGAQSPEEIAIAILSEMIAVKYGHRGASLKEKTAAHIHA